MSRKDGNKIVLHTPYYRASSLARQKEIDTCLAKNVECAFIDEIVLFIDDDSLPPVNSSRISVVRLKERPRYSDWILQSKKLPAGTISLLANSDIYFDHSLAQLRVAISDDNTFLALSRYDPDSDVGLKLRDNPHWTQDTWGYQVSSRAMDDALVRALGIPLGVPRCDNKVAYLFAIRGWKIVNPSKFIRSVHVHDTNERGYDKKRDKTVIGGVAYVHPGNSVDAAASIEVDIWAQGCEAIKKVSLNRSFDKWARDGSGERSIAVEPRFNARVIMGARISRSGAMSGHRFSPASISECADAIFNGKVIMEFRSRFKVASHKGDLFFIDSLQIRKAVKVGGSSISNSSDGAIPAFIAMAAFIPASMDMYPVEIEARPTDSSDVNFWQYPALTERKAWENHADIETGANVDKKTGTAHVYIGLPWATYIDKKRTPDDLMSIVRVRIEGWKALAEQCGYDLNVHTACQHIHWRRIVEQCIILGVTDLHVSHKIHGEDRQGMDLRIHGWPLIAVNVENQERRAGLVIGKEISAKKYLASFVGAHAKNYRSQVRLLLREEAARDGGTDIYFELKDEWHYERIVYREQVRGEVLCAVDHTADERETQKYNEIVSDSIFSLCPEGSGPNTLRLWESMAVGSIPVVVTDDWGRVDTSPLGIKLEECCIFIKSSEISGLFDRLRSIPEGAIADMQKKCLELYPLVSNMKAFNPLPAAKECGSTDNLSVSLFDGFKPSYVWPNPAFPFRVYFESPQCRIFIIENIQHNWQWLSKYHGKLKRTDVFLVLCGWFHGKEFAKESDAIFRLLGLNKENFFFLYNSPEEQRIFSACGFIGDVIPQNAWLDENLVMQPMKVDKIYDAIYVARRSAFKRHHLAGEVKNLALVAGINHGNMVCDVPPHIYINSTPLAPAEVCEKINQSRSGLLLSEVEGGCYASSEYLLCGVPVVSTLCKGGRDVWYNAYNSIICNPDPKEIARAVQEFVDDPRDPERIRSMHLSQANKYREKFIEVLAGIFERHAVGDIDAEQYFKSNFIHKMRKSYRPNFDEIFS